jgi:hypothetical protein
MPKFCEVTEGTKKKKICQATVGRTCLLAVPQTIKMGPTGLGNKAKALKYSGKKVVICYQLRTEVKMYRHPPRYTADVTQQRLTCALKNTRLLLPQ